MVRTLLAALASAAAVACASNAGAVTFTGGFSSFTASSDGLYEIDAWGAQGGSFFELVEGGLGAMVGGQIYLHAGDTLSVVVGGVGSNINGNTGAGGGGGTFVFVSSDLELLLAAGGGGGTGWYGPAGSPGLVGINGGNGSGAGGIAGLGGQSDGYNSSLSSGAGGGAGWLGAGQDGHPDSNGYGIYGTGGVALYSFQGGVTLGCLTDTNYECENGWSGGFGGGGGAAYNYGGGGGGYSGGGGGGGGGGSYISDEFSNIVALAGVRSGNGLVTIDLLPVPEPATWAMMLLGFFGLGAAARRRRRLQRRGILAAALALVGTLACASQASAGVSPPCGLNNQPCQYNPSNPVVYFTDFTVPTDGTTEQWDFWLTNDDPDATLSLSRPNQAYTQTLYADGTFTITWGASSYEWASTSAPGHLAIRTSGPLSWNNCADPNAVGVCGVDYTIWGNGTSLSISSDRPGLLSWSVTSVPEPSTWAMMLLGFLGLGRVLRMRRSGWQRGAAMA